MDLTDDIIKEIDPLSLNELKYYNPIYPMKMVLRRATESRDILRMYIQKDKRFDETFIHNLYFDDDYAETRELCREENISIPDYLPYRQCL